MISRGLQQTAALWPTLTNVYGWIERAATILRNEDQHPGAVVRRAYQGLLGAMSRWQAQAGALAPGIAHFIKVTRSYWSGLFHCYDIPELPRTNNDLEQCFGSWRYHQRRSNGRKVASLYSVLRGSVQLVATMATQCRTFDANDLATVDHEVWRQLQAKLEIPRQKRLQQRRFRHNPTAYLAQVEAEFFQLTLQS